jgi:hypothetical protein
MQDRGPPGVALIDEHGRRWNLPILVLDDHSYPHEEVEVSHMLNSDTDSSDSEAEVEVVVVEQW